jgi:hypothetical protein
LQRRIASVIAHFAENLFLKTKKLIAVLDGKRVVDS